MQKVFDISESDAVRYKKIIEDYYKIELNMEPKDAVLVADTSFKNLVAGFEMDGREWTQTKLVYFDSRLKYVTNGFWQPRNDTERKRYRLIETKTRFEQPDEPEDIKLSGQEEKMVYDMKVQLFKEYPLLERSRHLAAAIDNYCTLTIKLKKLVSEDVVRHHVVIKNLNESLIKLASHIGISEVDKQKQQLLESKDNIASLAIQFERTIKEFPEIMEGFKFNELKILLQKLQRQELTRQLFEHEDYAGMSPEEAQTFIELNKDKFQ